MEQALNPVRKWLVTLITFFLLLYSMAYLTTLDITEVHRVHIYIRLLTFFPRILYRNFQCYEILVMVVGQGEKFLVSINLISPCPIPIPYYQRSTLCLQ